MSSLCVLIDELPLCVNVLMSSLCVLIDELPLCVGQCADELPFCVNVLMSSLCVLVNVLMSSLCVLVNVLMSSLCVLIVMSGRGSHFRVCWRRAWSCTPQETPSTSSSLASTSITSPTPRQNQVGPSEQLWLQLFIIAWFWGVQFFSPYLHYYFSYKLSYYNLCLLDIRHICEFLSQKWKEEKCAGKAFLNMRRNYGDVIVHNDLPCLPPYSPDLFLQ